MTTAERLLQNIDLSGADLLASIDQFDAVVTDPKMRRKAAEVARFTAGMIAERYPRLTATTRPRNDFADGIRDGMQEIMREKMKEKK